MIAMQYNKQKIIGVASDPHKSLSLSTRPGLFAEGLSCTIMAVLKHIVNCNKSLVIDDRAIKLRDRKIAQGTTL